MAEVFSIETIGMSTVPDAQGLLAYVRYHDLTSNQIVQNITQIS